MERLHPKHARLGWLLLALLSCAVLATARLLTPAARGLGTHTELGLPPCGFLSLFHLPCPACGLTTSFAHLARGALRASLAAHPLGLPLFLGVLLVPLRAAWELVRARPSPGFFSSDALAPCLWLYSAALCAAWLARLAALF